MNPAETFKESSFIPVVENSNDTKEERDKRTASVLANVATVTSMQVFCSDIEKFNAAAGDAVFSNLKTLYITSDPDWGDVEDAEFLKKCPLLEYVRICQPIVRCFTPEVFEGPNLKRLVICHDRADKGNFFETLTKEHGSLIRCIETIIDDFPPKWLTNSLLEKCENMENLVLKSESTKKPHKIHCAGHPEVPKSLHIKNAWIYGNVCRHCVLTLAIQCPKLKNLYVKGPQEYMVQMRVPMERRRLDAPRSVPLRLHHCRHGIEEKITKIDFVKITR